MLSFDIYIHNEVVYTNSKFTRVCFARNVESYWLNSFSVAVVSIIQTRKLERHKHGILRSKGPAAGKQFNVSTLL